MSSQPERNVRLPSDAQRNFASKLGIELPTDATVWDARRLINREVRRLGRAALQTGLYRQFTLLRHPRYGLCEIVRIGEQTLKITVQPLDKQHKLAGKKKVISAMSLTECKVVDD